MSEKVVEHVVHSDGGSSGAFLALAVVLLIAVLFLVLYFTGALGGIFDNKKDIDVDVDINKPGTVLLIR